MLDCYISELNYLLLTNEVDHLSDRFTIIHLKYFVAIV